jgi:hypothetical protein
MIIKTRKFKDKSLIKIIKQAVRFYALDLIPNDYNEIYLDIQSKNIKADGTCLHLDDLDFEIEINNKLSFEHMMITLAHEMVHVKQYAKKELKSKYLKGKSIDTWKGVKYKDLKYDQQPWEQEATLMEQEMFTKFLLYGYLTGTLDSKVIDKLSKQ